MFERVADDDFAYLTTVGRKSGRAHRSEIWFVVDGGRVFLLSGGGDTADWVQNIGKNSNVRVQVGMRTVVARARIARRGAEDQKARELLDTKCMSWTPKKRLSSWARG